MQPTTVENGVQGTELIERNDFFFKLQFISAPNSYIEAPMPKPRTGVVLSGGFLGSVSALPCLLWSSLDWEATAGWDLSSVQEALGPVGSFSEDDGWSMFWEFLNGKFSALFPTRSTNWSSQLFASSLVSTIIVCQQYALRWRAVGFQKSPG